MKYLHGYCALLTAAFLFSGSATAFAAEDREKITSVNLTIEADYDDDSDDFEDMDLDVFTDDDEYSVDEFEVTGTSSSHPVIEVTLTAEDDYYFSLSTDDINIDGEDGTVTSKSTKNDKETLILKIKLTDISDDSDITEVDSAELDSDGVGSWDEVDDAKKYEVRFYRGSTAIGSSETTKNTEYYFGSLIDKSGNYSFKVRAIGIDNEKTDWIESNSRYFSFDPDLDDPIKFSGGNSKKNSGSSQTDTTTEKGWVSDNGGWWYRKEDGSYPAGEWFFTDENWFHFDANGYMQTGWITDGGLQYYLNPVSDGTLGRMITGWHWIDGRCYYFNPSSDGTKGAMMSNTVIDGQYRLGSDGAMVQ